jgi:tetratricopeptide (TPR) repeat protein
MKKFRLIWLLLCVSILSGCATQTRALLHEPQSQLPPRIELSTTPFFAQKLYQCGPAALAMSLGATGIEVSPDEIQPEVYTPARKGSLQPEMLAAARHHGALALTIAPNLNALLTEVAAGHPIIILQNLGLSWLPRWHYAVVIGYDLERKEILLHSGLAARQSMAMRTFEHTWARSQYWGMLVLAPGKLPADLNERRITTAALMFEKAGTPEQALRVYKAAIAKWPDNLMLQLGLGNSAYLLDDLPAAEAAFRSASLRYTDNVPVLNNLATILQEQGKLDEALIFAEQAVALGGPLLEKAQTTLTSIQALIKSASVEKFQ